MSARLTVVLDDEDLYRRAKVWAAERGIPLKQVIESALRSYLGPTPGQAPRFTRQAWEEWQAESQRIEQELLERERRLAEERSDYGA